MSAETKMVFTFRYMKDGEAYGQWSILGSSEQTARIELAIKYKLGDTPLELVETFPDRRKPMTTLAQLPSDRRQS